MNKSRLVAFVLTLLLCTGAMAQGTNKEINKIKRDEAYLYAEATMASEKEAREVATELLLMEVQEYIESMPNLGKAGNVLIKDMMARSESLMMMRGEMHRVFVYVKKQNVEGTTNTTIINPAACAAISTGDIPIEETVGQSRVNDSTRTKTIPQPEPIAKQPTTDSQLSVADYSSFQLSAWQQDVVDKLLQCTDMAATRSQLGRLKAEHKIKRFGSADDCQSRARAFWIILDDEGKVVTVLGPGAEKRLNFRTKETEILETYRGYNAIWFNL